MSVQALWIEDEPQSVRFESLVAEERGWHVEFAATVEEALVMSRDRCFNVIIADLILPRDAFEYRRGIVDPEAGIHMLEQIRGGRPGAATPSNVKILVVSAVISPELRCRVTSLLDTEEDYLEKHLYDRENCLRAVFDRAETQIV